MFVLRQTLVTVATILIVGVLGPTVVSAQVHYHGNHGHSSHYHATSVPGIGLGYGTGYYSAGTALYMSPGITAGVVTPYPLGLGAVPYPIVTGYGAGGWYAPSIPYGYGNYGYGAGPYGGGYWLPPISYPAENLFGPGPVRRMMGVDPPLGTPIVNNTTIVSPSPVVPPIGNAGAGGFGVNANPGGAAKNVVVAKPNVRVSNPQTLDRSKKEIERGDADFAAQQYAQAFSAYKDATRMTPDLGDAYFRLAAAAVAIGRYDDAATALKTGLQLAPQWVEGPFRFAALYNDNKLAQAAQLRKLEEAVETRPTSDLLFLVGVWRYFGDRRETSVPYFHRARALALGEAPHIRLFLQQLPAPLPQASPQGVPAVAPNFNLLDPEVPPQGPNADAGARDL